MRAYKILGNIPYLRSVKKDLVKKSKNENISMYKSRARHDIKN